MLESVYENVLAYDLIKIGMNVKTQVPIPLLYEEVKEL
ncbi:MAG: GxxExxY protein [bacterium]